MVEKDVWNALVEYSGNNKYSAAGLMGAIGATDTTVSSKEELEKFENDFKKEYPDAYNSLKNAKSVEEASTIITTAIKGDDTVKATITSNGNKIYNTYNSTTSGTTNTDSGTNTTGTNSTNDSVLEIHPESLSGVCDQWKSDILAADIGSIDVTGSFSALTSAGVAVSYVPSLKTALESIETSLLSASNMIKSAVDEQEDVDNSYNDKVSNRNSSSRNSSSNSSSSDSNITDTSANTGPPQTEDNKEKDLTINKDFIDKINKLDSESYIKFLQALGSVAPERLAELLLLEELAPELKKMLLASPYIDADLKKIIMEMDENELQVSLRSLIVEDTHLTDGTKEIIYAYTEMLKNETGDGSATISKGEVFLTQVDDILDTIEDALKDNDAMDKLSNIYDGDVDEKTKSSSVNFVRSAMDTIAEKNNVSATTLMEDNSYKDKVISQFNDLSKSLAFFKFTNTLGSESSLAIYENMMK